MFLLKSLIADWLHGYFVKKKGFQCKLEFELFEFKIHFRCRLVVHFPYGLGMNKESYDTQAEIIAIAHDVCSCSKRMGISF